MASSFFKRNRVIIFITLLFLAGSITYVVTQRDSPKEFAAKRSLWASASFDNGDYETAAALYEAALRKDDTLTEVKYNLALAYEGFDNKRAIIAWKNYLEATEGDPSQKEWRRTANLHLKRLLAEPILGKAAELSEQDDNRGAIEQYEAAIEIDDTIIEAHYELGVLYKAEGEFENSASSLEYALKLAPYSLKTRFELATVYEEFDKEKAIEEWEEFDERSRKQTDIEKEKIVEGRERLYKLKAGK